MYASLNAKAVLCKTAPESSFRFDVKRYDAGIVSLLPRPSSSAYLITFLDMAETTLLLFRVILLISVLIDLISLSP